MDVSIGMLTLQHGETLKEMLMIYNLVGEVMGHLTLAYSIPYTLS